MSDEDKKKIKVIIIKLKIKEDDLENILNEINLSFDDLFIKLFNEIIHELDSINEIIIKNDNKKNFSTYSKEFLYESINLFIKINKNKIQNEIIEGIISKENLYKIMQTLIGVNKNNIFSENIREFNQNLLNFISDIFQNKQELILEDLLYYKDTILLQFLISLSRYKSGRAFVYDIEQYILNFIQDNKRYIFFIESLNDIINCLYNQINERNFTNIIEEILQIFNIYKNHMKIISISMKKLLVEIFNINETKINNKENDDTNYNIYIQNLLQMCFNRFVFTFSSNYNQREETSVKIDNKNSFQFNTDFMNFLLEVYQVLIDKNLKNGYSEFLMQFFLSLDNIGNGAKRYQWVVKNTKFPEIVLESIIKLKENYLLSLYMTKILNLSLPHGPDYYKPFFDLQFLFSKLDKILVQNNEEKSIQFFDVFSSQLLNLIHINNSIINKILEKNDIFNISLPILNSSEFSKENKNRLIELLEKIANLNSNKDINYKFNFSISNDFELEDNFDLNDTNTYGIKYKLYLLYINSDISFKNFIENIDKISEIISFFGKSKKVFEILIFTDILLKCFLTRNYIEYINDFNQINLDKIKEVFFSIPPIIIINEENDSDEKLEIIINKFIELIVNFIYSFNKKIIDAKKSKLILKSKAIFTEDILIKIFQNLFERINNLNVKNKIVSNIITFSFSSHIIEERTKENNNKIIIKSPFFILISLKALYNNQDYSTISQIYGDLIELINFSLINIKILLGNEIIPFTLD